VTAKQASKTPKSTRVFGQRQKPAKMFWTGLGARLSKFAHDGDVGDTGNFGITNDGQRKTDLRGGPNPVSGKRKSMGKIKEILRLTRESESGLLNRLLEFLSASREAIAPKKAHQEVDSGKCNDGISRSGKVCERLTEY
jgi:hypothetical protein